MYQTDKRTVITLDAGGTNFVFGAIRGNQDVIKPISLPSNSHDLGQCLETLERGFREVINALDEKPVAISFAFPGPADYPNGIIGGYLPNFPSFRDGVALGPFLEDKFGIPVFINNDADLFAYAGAFTVAHDYFSLFDDGIDIVPAYLRAGTFHKFIVGHYFHTACNGDRTFQVAGWGDKLFFGFLDQVIFFQGSVNTSVYDALRPIIHR